MIKPQAEHFCILGGGTAGWMTALLFQRAFSQARITLIESSSVGTIGVGEGSTPALKSFFDAVDIAESDWMPRCGATYKSGITFHGWSTTPGFEHYFHPFLSHFDRDHIKALQFNSLLRRSGRDVHAHPDMFCYSHYLAERQLCPRAPYSFPFEVQYGYHFNAGLLGAYLKELALERGINWQDSLVESVEHSSNGDLTALVTDTGERLMADFFVDCSGFASILTEKALGIGWQSYDDSLFNDRAVTIGTEAESVVSTQTTATALRNGWAWHIPQQDRVGNGYVYSSRFCTEEEATRELAEHLGLDPDGVQARHIRFRTGRVESVWNRNTLAVGLSQGFLEPLEATALALVQLTIARFVSYYRAGGHSDQYRDHLNREVAEAYDGVKNYIHTHFLLSDRDDSEYWRACRSNAKAISPELKRVIETWFARGDLAAVLQETGLGKHYKINSWLYILAGMGVFPPAAKLSSPEDSEASKVPLDDISTFFERLTKNHMSQAEAFALLEAGQIPEADERLPSDGNALEQLLGLEIGISAAT